MVALVSSIVSYPYRIDLSLYCVKMKFAMLEDAAAQVHVEIANFVTANCVCDITIKFNPHAEIVSKQRRRVPLFAAAGYGYAMICIATF